LRDFARFLRGRMAFPLGFILDSLFKSFFMVFVCGPSAKTFSVSARKQSSQIAACGAGIK
jgi:hypothetical protein